jgi:hypothetical protein
MLAAALGLLAIAPRAHAQALPSGQARNAEALLNADLEMAEKSAPFRAVADEFIAAAAAGDAAKAERMISQRLVARAGRDVVRENIAARVLPFFADLRSVARSVTVANTTDAFGASGFAYYMYMVPAAGAQRPFVIYVLDEGGRLVVANILVDHYVEGRHP